MSTVGNRILKCARAECVAWKKNERVPPVTVISLKGGGKPDVKPSLGNLSIQKNRRTDKVRPRQRQIVERNVRLQGVEEVSIGERRAPIQPGRSPTNNNPEVAGEKTAEVLLRNEKITRTECPMQQNRTVKHSALHVGPWVTRGQERTELPRGRGGGGTGSAEAAVP